MANNLSAFGLSALNVVWSDTSNSTPVPGHPLLFTRTEAPQGLLLRKVSGIQEAISVGGLFLCDVGNPSKWAFWVGDTLTTALGSSTLGKYPKPDASSPDPIYDLRPRRTWEGALLGYMNDPDANLWVLSMERRYYGGDLYQRFELANYFGSTATVAAYGIVTAADEGQGYSNAGPNTRSYVATKVLMNVPFSKYMTDVKASQLALVPSDLRQYYDDVFTSTLAAFPGSPKKPTVAITTVWAGNVEVAPAAFTPVKHQPAYSSAGTPMTFLNTAGHPNVWQIATGIRNPASLGYSQDAVYAGDTNIPNHIGNGVSAWSEFVYTDVNSPQRGRSPTTSAAYRLMTRVGFSASQHGSYKGIVFTGGTHPSTNLGLQTGTVSGLNVGYLRDCQLLARSLVGGSRYALDTPNHANLADLVNSTLDDQVFVVGAEPTFEAEAAAEQAALVVQNEDVGSAPMNQRGTLPYYITEFNRLWDENAKALAKSQS